LRKKLGSIVRLLSVYLSLAPLGAFCISSYDEPVGGARFSPHQTSPRWGEAFCWLLLQRATVNPG
jgi:hypothetical protein